MRRILLILTPLLFISSVSFAGLKGITTSGRGSIYNVIVTSMTSAALWSNATDVDIENVEYDNRTGYTMYLSTYSDTVVNTTNMYPLLSSTDATKPLWKKDSTAFRFAISSGAVPSTSGFYITITK